MHEDRMAGNPEDITLSQRIGLIAEDHLALHGIRRSSAQGKRILERFSLEVETDPVLVEHAVEELIEDTGNETKSEEATGRQFSLDSF